MTPDIFWTNVKRRIKATNTTQRGLSQSCGLSPRSIETWINRSSIPDAIQVYKIAQVLGVTVEYLVTGNQFVPPADIISLAKKIQALPPDKIHAIKTIIDSL